MRPQGNARRDTAMAALADPEGTFTSREEEEEEEEEEEDEVGYDDDEV